MSFRTDTDLRACFATATQQLDTQVENARQVLVAQGISTEDHSNRSGFGGGIPYFLWEHWFEQRYPLGPEVALARACVTYLEPLDTETPPEVELDWRAEIFQLGQLSRFKREEQQRVPLGEFLMCDFPRVVLDSIHYAQGQFPHVAY